MERDAQDIVTNNAGSEPDSAPSVELDQFHSVHRHLHERLCNELAGLEKRVRTLQESPSAHSPTIIRTYERMIRKKRDFMESWGMDTSCGCQ